MIDFDSIVGFEWDGGNARKSALKHEVSQQEAEEVFFNQPLLIAPDFKHSGTEGRFLAFGSTQMGRPLTVVFTLRQNNSMIRVISARDQHTKERRIYAQHQQ